MAKKDLTKLTVDELEELNIELGEKRAEAEIGFKVQQSAIQAELSRRAVYARVEGALEGLSPEQRDAILAELEESTNG